MGTLHLFIIPCQIALSKCVCDIHGTPGIMVYYVSKKVVILDTIILSKEVFFSLIVYELVLHKHYLSKFYCMKKIDKIEHNLFFLFTFMNS